MVSRYVKKHRIMDKYLYLLITIVVVAVAILVILKDNHIKSNNEGENKNAKSSSEVRLDRNSRNEVKPKDRTDVQNIVSHKSDNIEKIYVVYLSIISGLLIAELIILIVLYNISKRNYNINNKILIELERYKRTIINETKYKINDKFKEIAEIIDKHSMNYMQLYEYMHKSIDMFYQEIRKLNISINKIESERVIKKRNMGKYNLYSELIDNNNDDYIEELSEDNRVNDMIRKYNEWLISDEEENKEIEKLYYPKTVRMSNADKAAIRDESIKPKIKPVFESDEQGLFYLIEIDEQYYIVPKFKDAKKEDYSQIKACFNVGWNIEEQKISYYRELKSPAKCRKIADRDMWELIDVGEIDLKYQ